MNEKNTIEGILNKMNAEFGSTNDFLEQQKKCIKELTILPNHYSSSIGKYGKDLLEQMLVDKEDDSLEYKFIISLYALMNRDEKELVFLLATQALKLPQTEDNYRYVTMLEELDLLGTLPLFLNILPLLESFDEYGGHAQERIIEYLISKNAEHAYSVVKQSLFDEADRVRATALQFMLKFDKQEVAPVLIKILEDEDVQYNILLILKLLKKWDIKQALPLLNRQLKEEWVYEDEELSIPFQQTINYLNQ